jgi:cytochrome o ubiquinol oxidase subunit III
MTHSATPSHLSYQDVMDEEYTKNVLGFWIYLMTDAILFTALFATYAVFENSTYAGPTSEQLYNLSSALQQTLILLVSSFTCGLSILAAYRNAKKTVLALFAVTFILGAAFIALELKEFHAFVIEGASWERSAFLSSYFTLVGTHGTHITVGLLWMIVLSIQIWSRGLTPNTFRRHKCFSLFWHFLDVIWIYIFTVVYLMGSL